MIHLIIEIPGDGVESNKQNVLVEEECAEVGSADVSGSGSDYQKKALRR